MISFLENNSADNFLDSDSNTTDTNKTESNETNSKTTATIDDLKVIVEQLKTLSEEVGTILETDDFSTTNDAVKHFVEIKKETLILTQDFRKKAKTLLSSSDIQNLRIMFKDINKNSLKELKNQIQERKRALNKERTKAMMDKMNIHDEAFLRRVESGEVNSKQITPRLREKYNSLSDDEKKQLKENLTQERTQRNNFRDNKIKDSKSFIRDRTVSRINARAQRLERSGHIAASSVLKQRAEERRKILAQR